MVDGGRNCRLGEETETEKCSVKLKAKLKVKVKEKVTFQCRVHPNRRNHKDNLKGKDMVTSFQGYLYW